MTTSDQPQITRQGQALFLRVADQLRGLQEDLNRFRLSVPADFARHQERQMMWEGMLARASRSHELYTEATAQCEAGDLERVARSLELVAAFEPPATTETP